MACAIQRLCTLLVPCSHVLFLPCVSSFKVASLFHQPHGFYIFSYVTGASFYQHLYVFNATFNPSVDIYMHWWGRTAASHVRMVHDSVCMLLSWHQFTPLIGHRLVTKAMIKPPLCLKVDHSVCYRTVFAQFRVRQTMTIVLFMASYVGLLNRQSSVFLPLKWV